RFTCVFSVRLPLHPFPCKTGLFETRWWAVFDARRKDNTTETLAELPVEVVRPSFAAIQAQNALLPDVDELDHPVRLADVPWLAKLEAATGSATIQRRTLAWTATDGTLDGRSVVDDLVSVQPFRTQSQQLGLELRLK